MFDLAVLALVAQEDGYGTLRRLYNAGALTSYVVGSDEGPHRKYYDINKQGHETLVLQAKTWRSFAWTMESLLTTAEGKA